MATLTHDATAVRSASSRTRIGLAFALVSAASFGLSGSLARGLLEAGWSPGAVVVIRILVGALVLTPFALRALRGRFGLLRRNAGMIVVYGLLAVAATQFCYFAAIQYMQVGPAILIEYTAPAVVVGWMWLRHGHRPSPITLVGAVVAGVGLLLVLDVLGAMSLSTTGVLWALGAMVGNAAYFILGADESRGLPPITLAWAGLVVGGLFLAVLGAVGLLRMDARVTTVELAGAAVPWWVPLLLLGVISAAVSYGAGVAATRRLGSRLASFVGLLEVVASVLFAWLLLGELPGGVQLLGGVLILAGVIGVKLGERTVSAANPEEDATNLAPAA